ncbi:hypothetical protein [Helicobacter pylori]|uniref:hypothetical protein n=1 Tax=Helicobacter pylori TaxID=210 RepID=UPI003593D329
MHKIEHLLQTLVPKGVGFKTLEMVTPRQKTILNFGKMGLSLGLEWKTLEKMGGF